MEENIKKARITIIDDDKELVDEVKTLLEENDFSVSCAYGGVSGLGTIKREKPNLIILDISMEDMDGRDVLVALKKDEDTKNIPIIFLTGVYSQQFDRDYGIELGAYEYVTKPCSGHLILRAITNILRKQG